MLKVFVSIPTSITYLGNGGFVMASSLADELGKMGYETYVFSQDDGLTWEHFKWLSLVEHNFDISTFNYMLKQSPDEYKIIDMGVLSLDKVPKEILIKNLIKWDQDELLRKGPRFEKARRFTLKYLDRIAISNRYLEPWYRKVGFKGEIVIFENWVRDLFFSEGANKIPKSVGFQRDKGNSKEGTVLRLSRSIPLLGSRLSSELERRNDISFSLRNFTSIPCHGSSSNTVAKRMRESEYFLYYHYPKNLIDPLRGEGFGLTIFEAMACGCIPVVVEQDQIRFLEEIIPFVKDVRAGVRKIKKLMSSSALGEKIRAESLSLIEKEYRFDEVRKQVIRELLE